MDDNDFSNRFQALTGFPPLPWQTRLYREYLVQGRLPQAVDVPTGLGKTAVIALWWVALQAGACLPRRLVYVVDRRAVVDQATEFVEDMIERLPEDQAPPVSTLRGRHLDNRAWLDDPSRPAIVVGTVDMIGSRLLFGGYGVSRKMRPYQAGLLGADTLVVLDEAHLVPPFEALLAGIEADAAGLAPPAEAHRALVPRLRLLSLSATGRERPGEAFAIAGQDHAGDGPGAALTRKRLDAAKSLTVIDTGDRPLPEVLADAARQLGARDGRSSRCLVYCNSRDDAEKTAKAIGGQSGIDLELFIGARRGRERELARQALQRLGFLAGTEWVAERPAFLVATSAGEVGVDLDADHLVCDLVAWERMVQRLGRVNRRGEGDARVIVVDAGPQLPKSAGADERERRVQRHQAVRQLVDTLPALPDGGRDASPGALLRLRQQVDAALVEQATTSAPWRPPLTRPLLDAWAMTAMRHHTGRPEVAPWLRGWVDEEPRTSILWRAHLPLPDPMPARTRWIRDVEDWFEAAPPHLGELLETETQRVADWLIARAAAVQKAEQAADKGAHPSDPRRIVAIALDAAGDFAADFALSDLVGARKDRLHRELGGRVLVVSLDLAGMSSQGTLDKAVAVPPGWTGDLAAQTPPDARGTTEPPIPWRVERFEDEDPEPPPGWRHRFEFPLKRDADGRVSVRLVVYKWRQDAATEHDRAIGRAQSLVDHQARVAGKARGIGTRLGLPERWIRLLETAARLHDEGKRVARWQLAFNAPPDAGPWAKTTGPVNVALLDGYRHEFGSLLHAQGDAEWLALEPADQELVLHLIAAHHGRARPNIGLRGVEQLPPSVAREHARRVALRFARLQREWGPWGLAWWEALLRAADQQASRDNDARSE